VTFSFASYFSSTSWNGHDDGYMLPHFRAGIPTIHKQCIFNPQNVGNKVNSFTTTLADKLSQELRKGSYIAALSQWQLLVFEQHNTTYVCHALASK